MRDPVTTTDYSYFNGYKPHAVEREQRQQLRNLTDERVLLCVDLSYQTYRAAAAHPMLTSRHSFTGGLYGFFVTVAKMIRDTRATHIVFCQDVKPYKRSETYPLYKQLRKKVADDELLQRYSESMRLILETLRAANLPIWGIAGFESDDLIAHAVYKYRHRFDAIWGGTNDSDLFQLLWCERFRIYRQSLADVMDAHIFRKKFEMSPDQYVLWLAVQGTHNDVAGIDGIGPVKATNAIRDPAQMRSLRAQYAGVIDRNVGLIQLPHPAFPFEASLPTPGSFDHRELIRALSHYEIDFTSSIAKAFAQVGGR